MSKKARLALALACVVAPLAGCAGITPPIYRVPADQSLSTPQGASLVFLTLAELAYTVDRHDRARRTIETAWRYRSDFAGTRSRALLAVTPATPFAPLVVQVQVVEEQFDGESWCAVGEAEDERKLLVAALAAKLQRHGARPR